MTTYCLNPNETWLAVYTLNTGTMPTNNVVFSEITANLTANATSITVKTGEGALFTQWMIATLEQLQADWKTATAREVVLISWISWDTITLTRWYENCVMDDTASPKVLWNTPQAFTSWARISVYVSRALLNGVQTRLWQVNPTNYNTLRCCYTTVCNRLMNECDWIKQCIEVLNSQCFTNGWFGSGCDWDCIINWTVYLCANRVYQFQNLTINPWWVIKFEWFWVPQIKVYDHYINNGCIDTRAWFIKSCACTKCVVYAWLNIRACDNNSWNSSICPWLRWLGWSGTDNGCPWCNNASASCWWAWWKGWDWGNYKWTISYGCPWCPAVWENGWDWGRGWESERCESKSWWGWWGWWGWAWRFGNGWRWWDWGGGTITSSWYDNDAWAWWDWGNSWLWWKGWDWWEWGYSRWKNGWKWGCGYTPWKWWAWWGSALNCWYYWWTWWAGWDWILYWWQWGRMWFGYCYYTHTAGNWWNAITNVYWFVLNARNVAWNWKIVACGWYWWRWGWSADNWEICYCWKHNWVWWNWGNGADWWQVVYIYSNWTPENIYVNGGAGGQGGCWGCQSSQKWYTDWCPWTAWNDWRKCIYKIT